MLQLMGLLRINSFICNLCMYFFTVLYILCTLYKMLYISMAMKSSLMYIHTYVHLFKIQKLFETLVDKWKHKGHTYVTNKAYVCGCKLSVMCALLVL